MTMVARLRIILNDMYAVAERHAVGAGADCEVPLKIRLDRLHEVVQAAMGWTDIHLYEFPCGGCRLGRARTGRALQRPHGREEYDR